MCLLAVTTGSSCLSASRGAGLRPRVRLRHGEESRPRKVRKGRELQKPPAKGRSPRLPPSAFGPLVGFRRLAFTRLGAAKGTGRFPKAPPNRVSHFLSAPPANAAQEQLTRLERVAARSRSFSINDLE